MSNTTVPPIQLPASLDLPPHLSAHKYFFVCTLTVAAWDTLVLSPRTWRLLRTKEWPALKVLFHFMRIFMPIEFIVVAVAFFDTKWTQNTCSRFYLFEPICTAILLAAASAVHVIRIHAIYEKNRTVLLGMGALLALQIVTTAIACGFYRSVPLEDGQGCIAGPKHSWVGIYWVAPTLLYTTSFMLAFNRSMASLKTKPMGAWKLMLRDGLNLYGAVCIVNLINMLFFFIMKPTGVEDPIKTIVTSMATVLTTTMTMRIILSVRGSLVHGGSFALTNSSSNGTTSHPTNSSRPSHGGPNRPNETTFTIDRMHSGSATHGDGKPDGSWSNGDSSGVESKAAVTDVLGEERAPGVKVTVDRDREVDFAPFPHGK